MVRYECLHEGWLCWTAWLQEDANHGRFWRHSWALVHHRCATNEIYGMGTKTGAIKYFQNRLFALWYNNLLFLQKKNAIESASNDICNLSDVFLYMHFEYHIF